MFIQVAGGVVTAQAAQIGILAVKVFVRLYAQRNECSDSLLAGGTQHNLNQAE